MSSIIILISQNQFHFVAFTGTASEKRIRAKLIVAGFRASIVPYIKDRKNLVALLRMDCVRNRERDENVLDRGCFQNGGEEGRKSNESQ